MFRCVRVGVDGLRGSLCRWVGIDGVGSVVDVMLFILGWDEVQGVYF